MVRAIFFGSKPLGFEIFAQLLKAHEGVEWTVVHPDDAADERNCIERFRSFAAERGIAFHVVVSQAGARALIAETEPQIGFVCGWYWLFGSLDVGAFPRGLWGIHNSLLPKFRGGAPLVWSIIAGEREVGSTVFRISPGMDDGDVLTQVRVALHSDDNIRDALRKIETGLLEVVGDKWNALLEGRAVLSRQDEEQATWCGQRSDDDGGIDWSRSATNLHDFIRAQAPPYPCAWTWLGRTRLRVLRARPFQGIYYGTPGQVLRRVDDGVLIACGGETALELLMVRLDHESGSVAAASIIRSVKARLSIVPPDASYAHADTAHTDTGTRS